MGHKSSEELAVVVKEGQTCCVLMATVDGDVDKGVHPKQ